jgi:phospholipase C
MPAPDRSRALDHIVVVLFENRSLDNVLGHLCGPGDGKTFDGVIGQDLSNPIPAWPEHGAVAIWRLFALTWRDARGHALTAKIVPLMFWIMIDHA